jgi:hypothetical protein
MSRPELEELEQHGRMPAGLPLQALPMFFFIHVPKTGGTSLNKFLIDMFAPFSNYHSCIALAAGGNERIAELLTKKPDFYDDLMMIVGHYGYRHPLVHQVSRRRIILSVLRDPITRIVSLYDYVRRQKDHAQHDVLRNLSLREVCHEDIAFRRNCVNAQLLTVFGAKDTSEAQKRLRQENYLIGRFDHIPRFIRAIEAVSGLKRTTELPHLNKSPLSYSLSRACDQPDFEQAVSDLRQMNAA